MDKNVKIGEDIAGIRSFITDNILFNNYYIYYRYLDYYHKLYYNKVVRKTEADYWLAALTAESFEELEDILSNFLEEELKDKFMKDVIRMNNDQAILSEYEAQTLAKLYKYKSEEVARQDGYEQGIEENTINMIKNMLDKKMEYQLISELTNKTTQEIKEIEKSLKD